MSRISYLEMSIFGEGEPKVPVNGLYDGASLAERTYRLPEIASAKFAIKTLLYVQGYAPQIAQDLGQGFAERFMIESEQFRNGSEPRGCFYDFDLNDLTPRSKELAGMLIDQVAWCADRSARLMGDIGSLPLWRQGITLYGVSEPNLIHVTTLTSTPSV
jgi:hypothetical protein